MKKHYYKVLGISYNRLAKVNSIEEVKVFDIVGAGVENLVDAINLRKQMFQDYPDCYFTIRKCNEEDCFITLSTEEIDEIINYNEA